MIATYRDWFFLLTWKHTIIYSFRYTNLRNEMNPISISSAIQKFQFQMYYESIWWSMKSHSNISRLTMTMCLYWILLWNSKHNCLSNLATISSKLYFETQIRIVCSQIKPQYHRNRSSFDTYCQPKWPVESMVKNLRRIQPCLYIKL